MTILELLNRTPPAKCRLLARSHHGRRVMSHLELARRTGLSRSLVIKISHLPRWDTVKLEVVQRFASACGVDLLRPSLAMRRARRHDGQFDRLRPAQRVMIGQMQERLLRLHD